MPRAAKAARLVWRKEERKPDGSIRKAAGWYVVERGRRISTGKGKGEYAQAEDFLASHLADRHVPARERGREQSDVFIADIISVYSEEIAPKHADPKATGARLDAVLDFFGDKTLDKISGKLCRDYAASRPTLASARRQLEDLRSAINHYHAEGYVTSVPKIVLPEKPSARERWLTREEAARLLRAAWRMKQSWKGRPSDRTTGRHVARFILVALYTGTRSGAVCRAAMRPTEGRGYVDLDAGVFHRRADGQKETKKRQPPVRLPDRLLAHLRRWSKTQDFVVEWNGKPVTSVKKAFAAARKAAGLSDDVTPHILRHTAATWLMQAGVDPWKAAGFLGMSVETLIDTYAKHHPDFQADAAKAITSKRPRPDTRPDKDPK